MSWVNSFSRSASSLYSNNRYLKLMKSIPTMMSTTIDPLLSTQENAMMNLFEKVRPSVVYVSTFLQAFNPLQLNVMEVPSQTGSGFVWDSNGHIVTNYHVLGPSNSDVQITFLNDDGSRNSYRAKVSDVDRDKDVVVLLYYDRDKDVVVLYLHWV
jgi:S1-C subfamily serine protease